LGNELKNPGIRRGAWVREDKKRSEEGAGGSPHAFGIKLYVGENRGVIRKSAHDPSVAYPRTP